MRDYKIVACDFDGTICNNEWPKIGEVNLELVETLIRLQKSGNKVILWTCREGELLSEAVRFCKYYGLSFDAINDNLQESRQQYGNNCRKVSADIYVDDKNAQSIEWFIKECG